MSGVRLASLMAKVRVDRFFYKACGYVDEDLEKPVIGIVNSFEEANPGHIHLRVLADAVKAGVYSAGGTPVEVNVVGPCAAYSRNYRYDLPTRDAIADSMEVQLQQSVCDGLVCIGNCDKIIPGMWLGAARLNLPTIFVTGGPAIPGSFEGETTCFPLDALVPLVRRHFSGDITEEELERRVIEAEDGWIESCGACPEMTTANTVQMLTEAMGLALPYSSTAPAVSSQKVRFARRAGMRIVGLVKEGIRFADVVTEKALENAFRVLCAVGGGTNGALHLLALSNELELIDRVNLETLDRVSRETPFLSAIRPSGPSTVVDFHKAGGVPGVMKELEGLLHLDPVTVTGKTVGENLRSVSVRDKGIIRSRKEPIMNEGAFAVLKGNIAPQGSICRYTSVKRELLRFKGEANVCNSMEEAVMKLISEKVKEGEVLVVRYEGPRGGPGMTEIVIVSFLARMMNIGRLAIVTDGRYSGTAEELLHVGHVTPEAAIGGPLALVEDGDTITIDVPARRINVDVSREELDDRASRWRPPEPKIRKGVLAVWSQLAEQASKGATLKTKI
ncbi:MAG: dihydroxy-acid dehydratase [Candidatus Freyarchaeota archaeon]|nr:dihydroxy-acid dehydratase [Candidatus Freyrarchaeum guaymaensis]